MINSKKNIFFKGIKVNSVIFDMDGVITNSMPEHYRAWKKILHDEGINITKHEVYQREGQPGKQTVKELFALHGMMYTPEIGNRILQNKEKLFKEIITTRFIPGTRSLLKTLHKKKFRLALVTGTARHEMHKILPDEISSLFSVIITGNDVTHGKPHPEPFLKALKKLKIESHDAIVIENAPFGIEAAKKAKIKTIALETSLPRSYLTQADYIFSNIKELDQNINLIFKSMDDEIK